MAFPEVSVIFSPHTPPEEYVPLAREAERAGLAEVWVWEDCFYESGIGAAAAILGATEHLRVGIGLLPVPLRAVSLTAMEISTISRMFPGRLLPGIGHGILDWMGQAGVRAASPLTLLREQAIALKALLAGQEVTTSGRYVNLEGVQLAWPASPTPPVYIGGRGPKTLAVAGEFADGLILDGPFDAQAHRESLETALAARHAAGVDTPFDLVKFGELPWDASAEQIADLASAHAEVGITRWSLLTLDSEGRPEPRDGIPRLIEAIAEARTQLQGA